MDAVAWCRERVLVPGNPLCLSLPFAAADEQDAILVLRTLIGELGATADLSEASLGRTKLAWWREALSGSQPAAARHPVIQALAQSGVSERLASSQFDGLIAAIDELNQQPRFDRIDQLWGFCERLGGEAGRLEACLLGDQDNATDFCQVTAAAYLTRLVRDLAGDARANRWVVPLALQAEYQITRSDLVEGKSGPAFDGLVRSLLDHALRRAADITLQLSADSAWRHRHLLIHWSLDRRLAALLGRRPARILAERVVPGQLSLSWTAWRSARRLRRGRPL